jgi:hypothetical protein
MNLGNTLANALLDHIFGRTTYTAPATLHLALFTTPPTAAGGGVEVSGGSYARAAVTNNTTNFPSASNKAKTTGANISFPAATAGWGTVTAWGFFDASSGGNLLWWGPVAPTVNVASGDTARFNAGSLVLTAE